MKNRRSYLKVLVPLASLLVAGSTQAQDVDTTPIGEAMQVVDQTTRAAVASQERITRLSTSANSLFEEFQLENDNLEALMVLNAGWRRQIAIQERDLDTINESIAEVRNVTQELPMLMEKMISSMEQFVELDMPFHLEQRRARIAFARRAIDDPGISNAERFRQILVLYQTETAYGRTRETYPTTLTIDGVERDVDILRVGRVALVYQTKDRSISGAWDPDARQWVRLSDGDYRAQINQGIRIASGIVAPDIIELPITAPELAQ